MKLIRNILAVVGLLFLLAVVFIAIQARDKLQGFDEKSVDIYLSMASTLFETKDVAEAMVWKVPVKDGVSVEDVEDAMMAVATERNIAIAGISKLGEDIEVKTGKPYRFVRIYSFCRSRVAAKMLDFSDAYSSFMPCRISMVEDKQGKLWLYSMNMDPMIYGGKPLPDELKSQALEIRDIMLQIMHRGAAGEF